MASLNKLAIRGIRSFDDKQIAVIEFFPVTVIVGHNGSGKTTIIECLKYATTGDQPPNTRGGAFVHDPKMANEKEVKAQVKLRFHAANGQRMLAVRNLSVTVKKTGLTMKTLEGILALADSNAEREGKRGVISTKCAELDAEIPYLLGVSKAVLENVIFCHQEDAYWPLSEASVLKKKFDEIFEATKYTKALDSIRSLRKERVAELKVENERLEGLKREKQVSDKLKARSDDISGDISNKEIEAEEAKHLWESLIASNARFYASATKFRETYVKVESLQKRKQDYQDDLLESRAQIQEIGGTDEELEARHNNFHGRISEQRQKLQSEQNGLDDTKDELDAARKSLVELVARQGELQAAVKSQEQLVKEREELIREIGAKHQIKGYDHSPLEREKIVEFISRLNDLQRLQHRETDKIQADSNSKQEEINTRLRELRSKFDRLKQRKDHARERLSELQGQVAKADSEVDAAQEIPGKIRALQSEKEDKDNKLKSIQEDIRNAKYDQRVAEKMEKGRSLELKRDTLNAELRTLSLQADSRAKLDINRSTLKSKSNEVKTIVDINNSKFRKFVGTNAEADTMEHEIDRVIRDKDRECQECESSYAAANRALQENETLLSSLSTQLSSKRDEARRTEQRIKNLLESEEMSDGNTIAEAMADAQYQYHTYLESLKEKKGSADVYTALQKKGRETKCCPLCRRDMNQQAIKVFEASVNETIVASTPEAVKILESDVRDWKQSLETLQQYAPIEASLNQLRNVEIPKLEKQHKEAGSKNPDLSERAEETLGELESVKRELKELSTLKQQASSIAKIQDETENLKRAISTIEAELSTTGSTRTADDVQAELDQIQDEVRANEREKTAIASEKERQVATMQKHQNELMSMQVTLTELNSQLKEKNALESRVADMKKEQTTLQATVKDLDGQIAEGQQPIDRVTRELEQTRQEWSVKLDQAQRSSQSLNMSVDKLEGMNKRVERIARDRPTRALKEWNEKIEGQEQEINELNNSAESSRQKIRELEKDIHEADSSMANLRDNLRLRKLAKDIAGIDAEIAGYDMEEAAKAKRNFDDKYAQEKERETQAGTKYARLQGEVSSLKASLKTIGTDLQEYENINKRYKDQLVKVKLSDMANNDLEKYAKALDSAIMKYHSLKMEEVNDTMRHLWNKTYQGTDIDGIKICSDEGTGTGRRTYNYRVVMTKDQVEMDMRGRCSAGQKMLASIIIRLALADSFGQNCGILALDEPTNALDTENIDALAESLIEIINERKNQGHFQLIIITHDENFLRKLGQGDVMEYYWRVSRDSRQKSIIERHRFG